MLMLIVAGIACCGRIQPAVRSAGMVKGVIPFLGASIHLTYSLGAELDGNGSGGPLRHLNCTRSRRFTSSEACVLSSPFFPPPCLFLQLVCSPLFCKSARTFSFSLLAGPSLDMYFDCQLQQC